MTTILYLIIAFGLIGIVLIIYRKISVLANLSDEELNILSRKKSVVQRAKEIDYKQHWLNFMIALEKFLRRLKIVFLKIENMLSRWIRGLSNQSQIMTQKSKEWIKQREMNRRSVDKELSSETDGEVSIKVNKDKQQADLKVENEIEAESDEDDDQLSLDELKKPIKEEQKWINLIIENPKNITAYKFLGFLYWKQHNHVDAKSSLEMAVKLGSKDKKVKEVLAEIKETELN